MLRAYNALAADRDDGHDGTRPGLKGEVLAAAFAGYVNGYKAATSSYAVWRDGVQLVGMSERPIQDVYAEVELAVRDCIADEGGCPECGMGSGDGAGGGHVNGCPNGAERQGDG